MTSSQPFTKNYRYTHLRYQERTYAAAGLLDCTVFHGFHLADIENTAVHVVATAARGELQLAERCAREVGSWIWARRQSFIPPLLSSDEAVATAVKILEGDAKDSDGDAAAAAARAEKPVVINEASDNCGGGAPGDATHLLRAMLAVAPTLPPGSCAFSGMVDPAVAEQAHAAVRSHECILPHSIDRTAAHRQRYKGCWKSLISNA